MIRKISSKISPPNPLQGGTFIKKQANVNETLWAWLFMAPCLLGLLIFTYLPIAASFGLSFSYWNLLGTPHWIGWANYRDVLQDPLFWKSMQITWVFVLITGFLEAALGLGLAMALNQAVRGMTFFRTTYFLPFITPMVSVALVWGWLYDPQFGALNWILKSLGLIHQPVAWLYDAKTALWAIILLRVWKNAGYNVIIFLAGLQGIPVSLYESAALDGANAWQVFWRITLPMISPTLFFVLMVTLINAFQAFDSVYLLTQGGPEHSTDVLVYWMFKNAFQYYKIGPASAIAYIIFLLILVLTLIQWRLRKRWVLHES